MRSGGAANCVHYCFTMRAIACTIPRRPRTSQPLTNVGRESVLSDNASMVAWKLWVPPAACAAIRHYLTLAGRWPLAAGEPVWPPLRSDGVANFGPARPDARRPISGAQANNILRRRLRLAGMPRPEQYHVRDLRHTFARKYLAVGGDANGLGRQSPIVCACLAWSTPWRERPSPYGL